jgi:chemotaxis protein methyltransferase CheR
VEPTNKDLASIVSLVFDRTGINLRDGKRELIISRLQKRIRAGGFPSYAAYLDAVKNDPTGDELALLIDSITTNHTSFFREPQHFDFVRTRVLPELLAENRRPVEVWSAACSSGEECFTLAMTLRDTLPAELADGSRILGTDISNKVLKIARQGIYPMERVGALPIELLRRHFERGMGTSAGQVRVKGALQAMVRFEHMNLLEIGDLGARFDFIFCRNVMIYFDLATQTRVVANLERHLAPGGYLFVSHAESLTNVPTRLIRVAPAVYLRRAA